MATVRVRIVILTVRITLSVCPFNRMAHTANTIHPDTLDLPPEPLDPPLQGLADEQEPLVEL
jgi:hypothetical protein